MNQTQRDGRLAKLKRRAIALGMDDADDPPADVETTDELTREAKAWQREAASRFQMRGDGSFTRGRW